MYPEDKTPDFLKKARGLCDPIDKEGKPRQYISLLIPLVIRKYSSKLSMLKAAGVDTSTIVVRGYYTEYYSQYSNAKILKFNRALKKWERGEKWNEYIGFVISKLCKDETHSRKIGRMLKTSDSNSLNFMASLADELDEKQTEENQDE